MGDFAQLGHSLLLCLLPVHLLQLRPDILLHKEVRGVLGQHGKTVLEQLSLGVFLNVPAENLDFPPIRAGCAADGA